MEHRVRLVDAGAHQQDVQPGDLIKTIEVSEYVGDLREFVSRPLLIEYADGRLEIANAETGDLRPLSLSPEDYRDILAAMLRLAGPR